MEFVKAFLVSGREKRRRFFDTANQHGMLLLRKKLFSFGTFSLFLRQIS
jgi:hypothetical protein